MNQKQSNPFTPIFGKAPLYMAGRENLIQEIEEALASDGNDPSLVSLFVGARGMGKTAMLSVCADRAQEIGWVTARVTSSPEMLDEVLLRIRRSAVHLLSEDPRRKLSGVSVSGIGSLSWDNLPQTISSWRTTMDDVLDELEQTDTGLLITVDEVDPDLEHMTTLITAYQHFLTEGRKVALLMAGLPNRLSSALSGKSTSFLRRAARHDFDVIEDVEVERAFTLTLREGGKTITRDALDEAVRAIGGFPYMFQLVGYRTWSMAADRSEVGMEEVRAAIDRAQRELEQRVYDATLMDLTDADIQFLLAMLEDDGVTLQSDVMKRIGKQSGHVSKYKKRLLLQGIIRERSRGKLEFCLPGFRDYLVKTR